MANLICCVVHSKQTVCTAWEQAQADLLDNSLPNQANSITAPLVAEAVILFCSFIFKRGKTSFKKLFKQNFCKHTSIKIHLGAVQLSLLLSVARAV